MRGPIQYLYGKTGERSQTERIATSRDTLSLRTVQWIGGLMAGTFAAMGVTIGYGVYDQAMEIAHETSVMYGTIEAVPAAGEAALVGITGWIALEEATMVMAASRRIRVLEERE